MNLSKLSREDLLVGGGGLVLLIALLAFPWFSTYPFGAFHYTTPAIDGPGSAWAIISVIILFWLLVDLGLARFSTAVTLPTSKYGREMTRAFGIDVIVVLMAVRVLWHTGDWGWGFYADLILMVPVVVGAWLNAVGRSTPLRRAGS